MSKRSSLAASLGLALLVALGLGVAWAGVMAWCGNMAQDWLKRNHEYRNVQVLADGTVVISSQPRNDYSARSVRTLDGKTWPPEYRAIGQMGGIVLPGLWEYSRIPRELLWEQRLAAFSDYREPPTHWYFVHNGRWEGGGYFAGFDAKSKLRAGYLGTKGFRDDLPPPEECFAMDGRTFACRRATPGSYANYIPSGYGIGLPQRPGERAPWTFDLANGQEILRVDLRTGKSEKLMDAPGVLGIGYTGQAASMSEIKNRRWVEVPPQFLVARTPDRLIVADLDGKEVQRHVIPEQIRAQSAPFYLLADRTILWLVYQRREGDTVTELLWCESSGRILRREEVVREEATILDRPAADKWELSAVVPAPIALIAAVFVNGYQKRPFAGIADLAAALESAGLEIWPALLVVCVVAGILAGLCYRRQRRYAVPGTVAWIVFVFLTGVPGMLGYLLHRRWPVLELCPTCEKAAPRDRNACAHCRTEFPRPAPKATEVFA